MSELPSGAVTFLFSDIEGSNTAREIAPRSLSRGSGNTPEDHPGRNRRVHGYEVDSEGEAFFVAFASAKDTVQCALECQRGLAEHRWLDDGQVRVRMGVHTSTKGS